MLRRGSSPSELPQAKRSEVVLDYSSAFVLYDICGRVCEAVVCALCVCVATMALPLDPFDNSVVFS